MPKTKISEFSATPANNTDIDSINIAEGCAPSGINDAIRELMAQLKDFQTGAVGDSFNGPVGTSTAAAGAFTTLSASSTTTLSGLTASTALALDASKNVVSVTNTGTGNNVLATSPTLVTPILGTPTSATLTNATGLPIATGVSGLGTGIATALAVNTGSAGAPVLFNGALGTPTSGTVTNLTGTASININGTVGATTATTGAFTTLTTTGTINLLTVGRGAGAVASNTVVGASALSTNSTGSSIVAVGDRALNFNTANNNTALGALAGYTNSTGTENAFFGRAAGFANTTGGSNTAIGNLALNANTTASNNTAVGYQAGYLSTGAGNQLFGYSSGSAVTTGAKNVIIGSYTGSTAPISATGSNFVVLSDGDGNIVASAKTAQTFALQGGTLSSGTGLAFPATQSASSDANTLDDYEEGTWTPAYAFSTAGDSSFTYTGGRVGTYTKIGKLVSCFFYIDNATVTKGTTGSGSLNVTGLPFSITGNTDYSGGVVVLTDSYPVNPQSFIAFTGTTTASMRKTGGGSAVTAADFGASNTVFLRGVIQYLSA
jgi:hypothetical protein